MPVARLGEISLWYADQYPRNVSLLPVLLLHGAGGSHLDWPATFRRLPDRRVITLDLPGHGRSTYLGRASIAAYTESVLRLLNHLGIARCILAGHSMGGAIALSVAIKKPHCVAGLILIGTGARLPIPPEILDGLAVEPENTLARLSVQWRRSGAGMARSPLVRGMAAIEPDVLLEDLLACDRFDMRHALNGLSMPALVIVGRDDCITPVSLSEELVNQMGAAELCIVEDAGHLAALEQPDVVTRGVLEWLAGVDPGRSGQPADLGQ